MSWLHHVWSKFLVWSVCACVRNRCVRCWNPCRGQKSTAMVVNCITKPGKDELFNAHMSASYIWLFHSKSSSCSETNCNSFILKLFSLIIQSFSHDWGGNLIILKEFFKDLNILFNYLWEIFILGIQFE